MKTCLRLICENEFERKPRESVQNVLPYASGYSMDYLRVLDHIAITSVQRTEIATLLTGMFRERVHIKNWIRNVTWDYGHVLELIWKWLGDKRSS